MQKIILDLRDISDKEALYDRIESAFAFPDYFGRNLDALYDLLTEISDDLCIGLYLPDDISFPYLKKLHRTFTDAEQINSHLCVITFPFDQIS